VQLALAQQVGLHPERRVGRDLHLEDFGVERLAEVVDAARFITALDERVVPVHRGDENDRQVSAILQLLDALRGLEPVELWHVHVQQDDVDVRALLDHRDRC
jgi:hypothetical protein